MKKVLIIVDMLHDFINKEGALCCGTTSQEIVRNITGRLKEYRESKLPVIFLADAHIKDDLEFERFPEHCVAGTQGAEIIPELAMIKGEALVHKTRYDGFYETSLDVTLALHFNLEPMFSVIEVCGVCTSICVMDTVGQLANRDYDIVVHRNCVADFDQEMHGFALKRMEVLYGATII